MSAQTIEWDAQLMLLAREGDIASLEVLLDRYRAPVIHYLYRMVQNSAIAEELAQEVFLRVYRSRGTYVPTARFTTWLFRIATHVALNWIRDRRHDKLNDSLDNQTQEARPRLVRDFRPTAEQLLVQDAKAQEIRDAITQLPARQRAVVLMHKYEELEYTQIAEVMGTSTQAVKSLLFRAYSQLRGTLAHMAA